MPASSIDTILASSIMIILATASMAIAAMTLYPRFNELSHRNDVERYQQLAKYILLNTGTPTEWGSMQEVVPSSFGLATVNSSYSYQLDVDKVSRLNDNNAYSITYLQLLESFGVRDVALRIEVDMLFDLSTSLVSTLNGENEATYNFELSTDKSGLPVSAQLSCYVVSKNYVDHEFSSTSSSGNGSVSITIPNSENGTALLVSFAKAESRMVAFDVYLFNHNSSAPEANGTFMTLSPLNYALNVSFLYPTEEVLMAHAFTYGYNSELTQISGDNQTAEYSFPHLLDPSPMILVLTGSNESSIFAEWVAYPQLPLTMGSDLKDLGAASKIVSFTYIVTVNSALYKCTIKFVGPE